MWVLSGDGSRECMYFFLARTRNKIVSARSIKDREKKCCPNPHKGRRTSLWVPKVLAGSRKGLQDKPLDEFVLLLQCPPGKLLDELHAAKSITDVI